MASLRQLKSGNWQAQIRRVGLPSVTKSFSRKKDALRFIRLVEGDTELQRKLGKAIANIPTFKELCDEYMEQYSGRDHTTVGRLKWWCAEFKNIPVTKIDEFMVDDGLLKLHKKGRTGSTINRYKSSLSALFIYFIQHQKYKRAGFNNPVRNESVTRFPENPAKNRFLDVDEQKALLDGCASVSWKPLYLLVLMALTTGARKGELLSLRWSDIDFSNRIASLGRTKNGKPRLLPLTQPVIEELMKYRQNNEFLIFHSSVSKTTPFDIKKAWNSALEKSKIGHCRFHDLRHTAASNLVRAGRTLFEVGTLLGHSSTTMTARYSHLAIEDTQSMVDKVMGGLK